MRHLSIEKVSADRLTLFTIILFAIGIALRLAGLPAVSGDMWWWVGPWYDFIVTHDWMTALRGEYANYTPPYLYLLAIVAKANVLLPRVIAIKLISVSFDAVNAYLVYRIVRERAAYDGRPVLAAGLFLCLPTIAVNSATLGQADAVYTCFVLAAVLVVLRGHSARAMFLFGIALAFKAQAILLAPFLLLLTLKRRVPWWSWVLVPAAYLLAMIPALLAGRSLVGVLTVYLEQAKTYRSLSMGAANPYAFVPDSLYEPVLVIGLAVAAALALAWVLVSARTTRAMPDDLAILCATISVALMPFLLPKMHDRFFYLFETLSLLLAVLVPRMWIVPVAAQAATLLVYLNFLVVSSSTSPLSVRGIFLGAAALLNAFSIIFLLRKQWTITAKVDREFVICRYGRKLDPPHPPASRD